jgi:hypothetical protein
MTLHQTLTDLDSIFEAGIKAATQEEPSKKKLTKVLDRLDYAIASLAVTRPQQAFTPETVAPMQAYYKFVHAWHDNLTRFPKKVVWHYQGTLRGLTFVLFQRYWDGLIAEAKKDAPDVDFLEYCLDELVCMTCPNGCEDHLPFVCIPSRDMVYDLLNLQERIEGFIGDDDVEEEAIDGEEEEASDVDKLIAHVFVTRILHHMGVAVVDDGRFHKLNPWDELKSLVLH